MPLGRAPHDLIPGSSWLSLEFALDPSIGNRHLDVLEDKTITRHLLEKVRDREFVLAMGDLLSYAVDNCQSRPNNKLKLCQNRFAVASCNMCFFPTVLPAATPPLMTVLIIRFRLHLTLKHDRKFMALIVPSGFRFARRSRPFR